jgi:hypothetical protein
MKALNRTPVNGKERTVHRLLEGLGTEKEREVRRRIGPSLLHIDQLVQELGRTDAGAPWRELEYYRCTECVTDCINRHGDDWTEAGLCRPCFFHREVMRRGW